MRISDWSSDVCSSDLFAIVTTRSAADCEDLAAKLRAAIGSIAVPGLPSGLVSASVGIAGGTRTTAREETHHEATVDDLITMASRASTVAKTTDRRVVHGHTLDAERMGRSEEHTSELQSLMRILYAVFCLKKKKN